MMLESSDDEAKNVDIFAAGDKVVPSKTSLETALKTKDDVVISKSILELQAEYLRLEAEKEEIIMSQSRIDEEKKRLQNSDAFILKLLETPDLESFVLSHKSLIRKELFFRIAELANSATDAAERRGYFGLYDAALAAVKASDANLFSEITSDIQKEVTLEANQARRRVQDSDVGLGPALGPEETVRVYDSDQMLQQWMQNISNGTRSTMIVNGSEIDPQGPRIMRFPASLPLGMLPLLLRAPEVTALDVELLRTQVFTPDLLNNTVFDHSTYLATFRGNPAPGLTTEQVLAAVKKRTAEVPGLDDRVQILVLPDYQSRSPTPSLEKYSGAKFDPVFTVVSKEVGPTKPHAFLAVATVMSTLTTLVTSFVYSTDLYSLNDDFLAKLTSGDGSVLSRSVSLAVAVLGLQLVHELGHFVAARVHGTKLSLPIILPSLQIGISGSVMVFTNFLKNRKELFDVSIAGPLFGFLASLGCAGYGLLLTQTASAADIATFPAIPMGFFSSSLLLYQLTDAFLHISRLTDPTALVPIHPLVGLGVTGLLANALNFMPVGSLDGGRVALAIAGRQAASAISTATLLLQGVSFLENTNILMLFWLIFVVIFQRTPDLPPEDDVSPVASDKDDETKGLAWGGRIAALAVCLLCTAGSLVPQPLQVTQQQAMLRAESVEGFGNPGRRAEAPAPLLDLNSLSGPAPPTV